MKIIASILIAMIFSLLGLLKYEGYLNFGNINLIGYDNTFDTNLLFIKTASDYTLYIPELIYKTEKINIEKIINIDDKGAYILTIFLFFWFATGLIIYLLKYFPKKSDRIYLILGIIISYYLIVGFMK